MRLKRPSAFYTETSVADVKREISNAKQILRDIVDLCNRFFENTSDKNIIVTIRNKFDKIKGQALNIRDLYQDLLKIDPDYAKRLASKQKLNKYLAFYYVLSAFYLSLSIVYAFAQEDDTGVIDNYDSVIKIAFAVALTMRNPGEDKDKEGYEEEEVETSRVLTIPFAFKEAETLIQQVKNEAYVQELFATFYELFSESKSISIANFASYRRIILRMLEMQVEKDFKRSVKVSEIRKDENIRNAIAGLRNKSTAKKIIDYISDMLNELSKESEPEQKQLSFKLIR